MHTSVVALNFCKCKGEESRPKGDFSQQWGMTIQREATSNLIVSGRSGPEAVRNRWKMKQKGYFDELYVHATVEFARIPQSQYLYTFTWWLFKTITPQKPQVFTPPNSGHNHKIPPKFESCMLLVNIFHSHHQLLVGAALLGCNGDLLQVMQGEELLEKTYGGTKISRICLWFPLSTFLPFPFHRSQLISNLLEFLTYPSGWNLCPTEDHHKKKLQYTFQTGI